MVLKMDVVEELQKKKTIQQSVREAERAIDNEIKMTIFDENVIYKAIVVVAGRPNSTSWAGRGPLFLTEFLDKGAITIKLILYKLMEMYKEAGYGTDGVENIDSGMGKSALGFILRIPDVTKEINNG